MQATKPLKKFSSSLLRRSVKPETTPMPGSTARNTIGWREYVELPELGILGPDRIKAKIDSGARSCALHAINIRYFQKEGAAWIAFEVHPRQRTTKSLVSCQAPLLEVRSVKDSGGKRTLRPVILTEVKMGDAVIPIELTLVARDSMGFRMLIGRQAIRGRYLIDPGSSFILSPKKQKQKNRKKKKKYRITLP